MDERQVKFPQKASFHWQKCRRCMCFQCAQGRPLPQRSFPASFWVNYPYTLAIHGFWYLPRYPEQPLQIHWTRYITMHSSVTSNRPSIYTWLNCLGHIIKSSLMVSACLSRSLGCSLPICTLWNELFEKMSVFIMSNSPPISLLSLKDMVSATELLNTIP